MEVLIYSDCSLFGGSEHAVINLLRNDKLKQGVKYSFAYRYHASYHKKIRELLAGENDISMYPIRLLTNKEIEKTLRNMMTNKHLFRLFFAPFYLLEKIRLYEFVNKIILKKFVNSHCFDIVHVNNGGYPAARSCLLMTKFAKDRGSKVILQVNNLADPLAENDKKTNAFVVQAVDIFITASQMAKAALCSVLSISSDKVTTIPHFVPYVSSHKTREEIMRLHCLPEQSVMIVEVALLQKRKGQEELVQSIKQLTKEIGKPVELILIGNGENKEKIIATVEQQGMSEHVHLLGYRDDYIDYLNAADIVALPSLKDEDMPLTIISALSLGKPIVSTKLAGIPEEIEDGVSGILVDPKSNDFVKDLSEALYQAYQNRERLSVNARLRYEKVFSKEKFEESYIKLYNSL